MLLHVHSCYSLLDGTLTPKALVDWAAAHDIDTLALTDTGNLHGAVPFFRAAEAAGIRPILGAELRYQATPLLVYVRDPTGYRNLCRLITRRHREKPFHLSRALEQILSVFQRRSRESRRRNQTGHRH